MQQHKTARNIPHSHILTLDIFKKKKNSLRAQMSSLAEHALIILGDASPCSILSQPGQQWD